MSVGSASERDSDGVLANVLRAWRGVVRSDVWQCDGAGSSGDRLHHDHVGHVLDDVDLRNRWRMSPSMGSGDGCEAPRRGHVACDQRRCLSDFVRQLIRDCELRLPSGVLVHDREPYSEGRKPQGNDPGMSLDHGVPDRLLLLRNRFLLALVRGRHPARRALGHRTNDSQD